VGNQSGSSSDSQQTTQQSNQSSQQGSASSDSQAPSSTPAPAQPDNSTEERAIYESLTEFYDELDDFDEDIAEAATDFNNNWSKSDLSVRQRYEMECDEVLTDISQQSIELAALNVPSTSQYYDTYNKIVNLYDDCQHRISVISKAWGIANAYSDPKAHESEVLAPISADNVGGKNKYKKDFDDNYASAKPMPPA